MVSTLQPNFTMSTQCSCAQACLSSVWILKIVAEMFISRSSSVALLAVSSVIKSKCNFVQQTMRIYDLRSHSKQSACFFTALCCRQAGRVAVSTSRWNGTRVMKSKQAYYSEEALDEAGAPREDCTAVKGCIYSRFVFLWVGGYSAAL